VLLDANLLLYATDRSSPEHPLAAQWLSATLNGDRRVALPWQSIGAFLRISTHPRVTRNPLTGRQAWEMVENWLAASPVWIPPTGIHTARALRALFDQTSITGNLVPDAMLAALAIEHGLVIYSADSDFARFTDVKWINPLRPK
jgi:toxin-antitoxin system PIN domain toxin